MSLAELHKKPPPQCGDLVIANRQMRMVKITDGDPEYLDRSVSCGAAELRSARSRCSRCDNVTAAVSDTSCSFDGALKTAVGPTSYSLGTHELAEVGHTAVFNAPSKLQAVSETAAVALSQRLHHDLADRSSAPTPHARPRGACHESGGANPFVTQDDNTCGIYSLDLARVGLTDMSTYRKLPR